MNIIIEDVILKLVVISELLEKIYKEYHFVQWSEKFFHKSQHEVTLHLKIYKGVYLKNSILFLRCEIFLKFYLQTQKLLIINTLLLKTLDINRILTFYAVTFFCEIVQKSVPNEIYIRHVLYYVITLD